MELIRLNPGRLTLPGLWWAKGEDLDDPIVRRLIEQGRAPMMGGAASLGQAVQQKVLDHITNQTSYTMPTPYLGLWTSSVTDTSTAATAGELTYTTYARQAISSTNMAPGTAATPSVATNDVAITFPAVTAGGGTVTFWMLCSSSSGAGDNIAWGTATSTVISTTQTPPTIAIGGFVITLD
jgi:hypothetical protein